MKKKTPQKLVANSTGHVFQIIEFMLFVLKNIQALFPLSSEPKFETIERHEGRMEERKAREGGKEAAVRREGGRGEEMHLLEE